MKIAIVNNQAPFVRGGAEYLADSLAGRLRGRGHRVEIVRLPFKWYPPKAVVEHMLACRLLDVGAGGPDRVIALKFPAYLAPFKEKKVWLLHQFRQVYELWGTPYAGMPDDPETRRIRDAVVEADNRYLPEAKGLYTNSKIVAARLKRFNNIDVDDVLYPPLDRPELFGPGEFGDYFFYPSRQNAIKRQHVAVEAMRHVKANFRLVLAGKADAEAYDQELRSKIEKWGLQDRVRMLGWITEEEKARLMAGAFAALYLPHDEDSYGYVTLEAFHSHKPVLTFSDSGGTDEIVEGGVNGLVLDPTPEALARGMESLWAAKARAREMGRAAHETLVKKQIHWDRILDALAGQPEENMKIAWFTPFNPHSAIGHYSEAITGELAKTDQVVLYVSDADAATPTRPCTLPKVALGDGPYDGVLRQLDGFDLAVYNMGNHVHYHKRIYEVLLRRPGIVVIHDLVLRDFFLSYFLRVKRDSKTLARLMAYSDGPESEEQARGVLMGRYVETVEDPTRLQYPMFKAVLPRCLGAIVHSEYSRGRVAAACPAPVEKLDFPLFGPAVTHARTARPRPGRDCKVRIATFGVLHLNKLIHATIEAIAASAYLRANVEYTVVGAGEKHYEDRLRSLIERHRLDRVVRLTGRQSDQDLKELLARADIVVNLRNPHFGESSASLLDALTAGAATLVWNHGSYAEFPDDVVCKISSEAELAGALERLCRDADLRARFGAEARKHALARFDTALFCSRFRAFTDVVRSRKPILALTDAVSEALLEFGPRPAEGLVERLASEVAVFAGGAPRTAAA